MPFLMTNRLHMLQVSQALSLLNLLRNDCTDTDCITAFLLCDNNLLAEVISK